MFQAMNGLERRCIALSYAHGKSHVSSVLNTVNVLAEIYALKSNSDIVVLGNSHAALALFVVLEANGKGDAEKLLLQHGTHASRDIAHDIWVSGGSLGQADPVALGLAMADRTRTVHLVTSDGALAEGSIWETLAIADRFEVNNFVPHVIANGYGAYGPIDIEALEYRLRAFFPCVVHQIPQERYPEWLRGLPGHYLVLTDVQASELMEYESA